MPDQQANRRRSVRVPAAYPAVIKDLRGQVLARGRTANISETGVLVLARRKEGPPPLQEVLVELIVPALSTQARPDATRTVEYHSRIVRTEVLGPLVGMGIEFLEKRR